MKTCKDGTSKLISAVTKGHATCQLGRAKAARKLCHVVGAPTMDNFKSLLWINIIKNCPMRTEDVSVAEKTFGLDASSLKGKSARRKPKPVRKISLRFQRTSQ